MGSNFLSGGIVELQQAKNAVTEASRLEAEYNTAIADVSRKEKDLESQKKYVQDKINNVTKERRSELKKTHDEQVDAANKHLKDAEKKRKVAKSGAVQARITDETMDLVKENDDLKREVKTIFRENQVPSICNNSYYYAMYAPKRGVDFLIFVLTVVVCFGLIPNVVCLLLDTDKVIIKVLVYLAVVLFFVAIYFLFYAISKRNKKGDALEMARAKRSTIRENKKLIKKRSKSITKDTDESGYGLEEYDTEIAELQKTYDDLVQKRDDALKVFDEQTAQQIREEIMKENQETLDQMEETVKAGKLALEEAKVKSEEASGIVTSSYEVYLGKKNTTPERIDGLISLIQNDRATTIMEALDIQNGEIK